MENYEVNVLTRKGGWKKLSQTSGGEETQKNSRNNNDLDVKQHSIDKNSTKYNKITSSLEDREKTDEETNIFNDFENINIIINELQHIEKEKENLIKKLSYLEGNFVKKRDLISEKLNKVKKEHQLYENTISLINSLKNT